MEAKGLRLSEGDLNFLIETVSPAVRDRIRLKEILREDEDFKNRFISDKKVFCRIMDDEEILLKISPILFFEVLLRRVAADLKDMGYTLEKSRTMRIPVFDTSEVVQLLKRESLLVYLADMLSSFTRVESYAVSFRAKEGTWKKIRFSNLDLESLMSFCEAVEDEYRLGLYKRIADICLFVIGIFPEFAERAYRYPVSGRLRPQIAGKWRISPEEYEDKGRKFYRLAAEHQSAKDLGLTEVFWELYEHFQEAKKPLNLMAEHYLPLKKHAFFF
jgi:hypothetical protein